jgi:hypothetical protein
MQFDIFRHAQEVDSLELAFLQALKWRLWTSDATYSEYEAAVLRPMLLETTLLEQSNKKRRSLTAQSTPEMAAVASLFPLVAAGDAAEAVSSVL